MITNVLVAGSGLEMENGEVVGLSLASQLRAEYAAQLAALPEGESVNGSLFSPSALFHFSGAYPRLPRGVDAIPFELREGPLMRQWATSPVHVPSAISHERTSVNAAATSTAENTGDTLEEIVHGDLNQETIRRYINPHKQLGIIASRGQMPRFMRTLYKMGCDTQTAVVPLETDEPVSRYDKITKIVYFTGTALVPRENIRAIKRVDKALGVVNDGLHHAIDMAGRARNIIQKTTAPQRKVVS